MSAPGRSQSRRAQGWVSAHEAGSPGSLCRQLFGPSESRGFSAIRRHRNPVWTSDVESERFDLLFSLAQLEALLLACSKDTADVEFCRPNEKVASNRFRGADGRMLPSTLLALLRDGGRLCIGELARHVPAVAAWQAGLSTELEASVCARLVLDMPWSEAPWPLHVHAADAIVVQLQGSRHWQMAADLAGPDLSACTLHRGSALWLPGGLCVGAMPAQDDAADGFAAWIEFRLAGPDPGTDGQGAPAVPGVREAGHEEPGWHGVLGIPVATANGAIAAAAHEPEAHGELARLLAPMTVASFEREVLGRRFLMQRAAPGAVLEPLFAPQDMVAVLDGLARHADSWEFYGGRDAIDRDRFIDAAGGVDTGRAMDLYQRGSTLRVQDLGSHHPQLGRLCASLSHWLRAPASVTAWLSHQACDSAPVDYLHFDTPEVLVLQVHGARRWRLYPSDPTLYSARASRQEVLRSEVGAPILDVVLQPGDFLYVPGGLVHEVTPAAPDSVHLSFGVSLIRWRDVLDAALGRIDRSGGALNECVSLELLRQADRDSAERVLLDRMQSATQHCLAQLPAQALLDGLAYTLARRSPIPADGHFARDGLTGAANASSTAYRMRAGVFAALQVEPRDQKVSLVFSGGGEMRCPLALEPVLRRVTESRQEFTASSLAGDYTAESMDLLLRSLCRMGLLESVQSRGAAALP